MSKSKIKHIKKPAVKKKDRSVAEVRVLQVLPSMHSGGVEQEALEVALYLQKHGITNMVCSSGGALSHILERADIKHIKLPAHSKNPIIMLVNAYKLVKIIKKHQINILHARSRAPAWSCLLASKIASIPFITTFHGAYSAGHSLKRVYNSVMLRSDKVIAISKYITKYIETQYHFKSDSLTVIDRGVDISVFDHSNVKAERQESVMAALGLTHKQMEGKKILLVPARYSRIKGHLYLLKALAYLQYKDYLCIMIGKKEAGPNDYVHEIEKDIIAKKLSDKVVVCTTPTTDMPALYSLADIVVCPSTSPEGFGRTIIEAQAMHKVVIATNIGAPADIIAHGKTGFLAPVSDAATFSETLEAMLNMPTAEIQNIRDHAYQVVEEKYNLSVMCQRTIDTYCAALQECGL